MIADKIIKNAKIFTANKVKPKASALVVKDGKFAYVGDEAGLSEYEGEVTDLGGKFIMPGIIDSHVHVSFPIGFEYAEMGERIEPEDKQDAMNIMADYISKNPGLECYKFMMDKKYLHGAEITKEDLDAICPDAELQIQEAEGHSIWINSKRLASHGITDESPDPVPGLSYYVRKDGHVTGNIFEGSAEMPIILDGSLKLSDEQIDVALLRWIDFCVNSGVTGVFDSGIPGFNAFHERVYERLRVLDEQGKLPVYVDGCYVVAALWEVEKGMKELKRFNREFNSEHLKVHTMKVFMDGTQAIHTAAMVTPYVDTQTTGSTAFSKEELVGLLKQLNEEGWDLHLHTVGSRASRVVLDGVEQARKELGEDFRVKVTCAHLEVQDDADLHRFAKLGVIANYTPWWHAGDPQVLAPLLGEERARKQFRCKTVWDSGALVTWSSDNITFQDFTSWSPYLGMEVGMTRLITEKTKAYEFTRSAEVFPPADERMSIEEMILGYTINGAKQLGIEDVKGSIEAGKDADFLVFDNDLLTAEQEGFSHNMPSEVYFGGKKMTTSKSAHLLAEGYDLIEGLSIPLGITNKDLEIDGLEPENAKKLSIDGAQGKGKLNLYVFRPANVGDGEKTPVIYYMHGGGYQFGNTAVFEEVIQGLADENKATVVSVDYTLTKDPSYKYPMELEDAYAGLLYVYEHADELNVDKDNIILEGESAGGGLAARLALYNRDKGMVPLKGQVLVYPMLDYRTGGNEDIYNNEYAGEFIWTKENNVSGWADLMAGWEKKLTDKEMLYFSPAVAKVEDLKGLPETFMIVGSLDLFCDEDIDYAKKLIEAGVFTELHVEPGVPHAYDSLPWTPQTNLGEEMKCKATARMFGTLEKQETPDTEEYRALLKYISSL